MTFRTFHAVPLAALVLCLPVAAGAADRPRERAAVDCGGYVTVAMSVAINKSRGALVSHSRFYEQNRHRARFGPFHAVTFYDPYLGCSGADADLPPPPRKR